MAKFRKTEASDSATLGELQRNLHDNYVNIFSIVQELLQNADDAKAERVHLGTIESFSSVLGLTSLRGVYMVNDGPVESGHIEKIHLVGEGSKTTDHKQIGRFGLGMKSIYHVSDGFFLVSRGQADADVPTVDFCMPPWGKGAHDDWIEAWESLDDSELVRWCSFFHDSLPENVKKWPRYFGVWMPLRTLDSPKPYLIAEHKLPQDFLNAKFIRRTVALLPLLRHVREVSFSDGAGKEWRYSIRDGAARVTAENDPDFYRELRGEGVRDAAAHLFSYMGSERVQPSVRSALGSKDLVDQFWPKSFYFDDEGNQKDLPDKTFPHAAVIISTTRCAENTGRIDIIPCSFLPLNCVYDNADRDEAVYGNAYSANVSGTLSVTIYLHGFFFLDAGRKDVQFAGPGASINEEKDVKRGWNSRLLELGVLPLLIPRLAHAANNHEWPEELTAAVVQRILEFYWLKDPERLAAATRENAFCCRLTDDGFRWQQVAVTSETRFYKLDADIQGRLDDPVARKVFVRSLPGNAYVANAERCGLISAYCSDIKGVMAVRLLEQIVRDAAEDESILQCDALRNVALSCLYDDAWHRARVGFSGLSEAVRNLRFWKVNGRLYSYEELKTNTARLCSQSENEAKKAFLSVVGEGVIFEVDYRLTAALGLVVSEVSSSQIVNLLCEGVPLCGDIRARCRLLECLMGGVSSIVDPKFYKACRYLALGSSFVLERQEHIYIYEGDSQAWQWIVNAVNRLNFHENENVQIPEEISSRLTSNQKTLLGLIDCTYDTSDIRDQPGSRGELIGVIANRRNDLDFVDFPAEGWKDVVTGIRNFTQNPMRSQLQALPIYPSGLGRRSLCGDCFFVEGYAVPQSLSASVAVLAIDVESRDLSVSNLKQLANKWTPRQCILQGMKPENEPFAVGLIRDALLADVQLSWKTLDQLNSECKDFVVGTAWVELNNGMRAAPARVVSASDFPDVGGWYGEDLISEDEIRNARRSYDWISKIEGQHVCLFKELSQKEDYQVGLLPGLALDDACGSDFGTVFSGLDTACQPAVKILEKLGVRTKAAELLGYLHHPMSSERLIANINGLSKAYESEKDSPDRRQKILAFLISYLNEAAERTDFTGEILPKLNFINKEGKSCHAEQLFWEDEIVPSGRTFNKALYQGAGNLLLKLNPKVTNDVAGDGLVVQQSSSDKLKDYFEKSLYPEYHPLAAGFILGCSCDKADLHWAAEKLGENIDLVERRRLLGGDLSAYLENGYKRESVAIDPLCWCSEFRLPAQGQVSRTGVVGQQALFSAAGLDRADTLFNGFNGHGGMPIFFCDARQLGLHLRSICPEDLDVLGPDGVSRLLKSTLRRVYHDAFEACAGIQVEPDALDKYWETFDKRDQILVETTRAVVLSGVHDYLKVIGYRGQALSEPCKRLGQANANVVAARHSEDRPEKEREIMSRLKHRWQIETEIGDLINGHEDVQSELLDALRTKMEQYGYSTDSLLFELFQNADDAAEELRAFGLNSYHDEFRLVFEQGENPRLVIAHWGRPINRIHAEHEGFGRDLEKMIKMFQSDKQLDDGVTEGSDVVGKFGLGFKTVFLVSDAPVVMSGLLCFKIVGGLLPVNLNAEERESYGMLFDKFAGIGRSPTVIVLNLRPGAVDKVKTALKIFKDREALLAAFSNRIKSISMEVA